MAIGSGLGGSFGFSQEAVYGTRVAPSKFVPAKSISVNRVAERPQGEGIRSGAFGPNSAHYQEAHSHAEATAQLDVPYSGFGRILNTLMGGTVTPANQASTDAYLQTHNLADPIGKSLTIQAGVPQRDGTVRVHELTGGKVLSTEFTCERGGLLQCNVKVDGQKFSDAQTLAAPSYVAGVQAFGGKDMSIKVGTLASEVEVNVRTFNLTIERPLDVGAFVSGNAGGKLEPVLNGVTNISGSITVDWTTSGGKRIQDYLLALTRVSLLADFVGAPEIAATYPPFIKFKIPSVTWDGDIQGVDGPGEMQSTFNFTWRDDHTNSPQVLYQSVDVAL